MPAGEDEVLGSTPWHALGTGTLYHSLSGVHVPMGCAGNVEQTAATAHEALRCVCCELSPQFCLTLLSLNSGCHVWLVASTQCLEGTQRQR